MPYYGAKIGYQHGQRNHKILKLFISHTRSPTITIPNCTFDQDLFISRPGRTNALYLKRQISGFLTSRGYARWDIENNNDSNTVDCFKYSERMLSRLNRYLYEENININSTFQVCEVCGEELIDDDDIIQCANDTGDEHGTCVLGRLHYRCRRGYLRIYPNVSRNFEDDDWICGHCESQNN